MSKLKTGEKVTVTYEGTYEGEVFSKIRDGIGVVHYYRLEDITLEPVPPVPQAGDVWEVGKAGEDGELYFISADSGSYLTEGLKVTDVAIPPGYHWAPFFEHSCSKASQTVTSPAGSAW